MIQHRRIMWAWLGLALVAAGMSRADDGAGIRLAGQIELARLVDLCSERLGLTIEYDPTLLRGTVTLRLDRPIKDARLWPLTNRLLLARGLVSLRMEGADGALSIVRLSEARDRVRLEWEGEPLTGAQAGYRAVVLSLVHRPASVIAEAIGPLVSKHGRIEALAEDSMLLIAETSMRLGRIEAVARSLDRSPRMPVIERVPTHFLSASELVAAVTTVAARRAAMGGEAPVGELVAGPDETAVMLIAPAEALPEWRAMIEEFDRLPPVDTRSYGTGSFGGDQVRRLIGDMIDPHVPGGSGDRWKLVVDPLTDVLIITATSQEHHVIEGVMQRLDDLPPDAHRALRVYPIRHRGVVDILRVLSELIDGGALAAERSGDAGVPPEGMPAYRSSLAIDQSVGAASIRLTADEATNSLIAVADPRQHAQLKSLLERLDAHQPQVMIEVLVMSLSDGQTSDLGGELVKLERSGESLVRLTSLFGLGGVGDLAALPAVGSGGGLAILTPGEFNLVLRALRTINRGHSMNLPHVLVRNHETAALDAVTEEPFISTNASETVATTSFGGASSAGTQITVTPHITEGDHLVLEYNASVSAFVGESSDPSLPPPRQENRIASVVTIPDGHTVVVGGVELSSSAHAESSVPILGAIPFVGQAFRSSSRSRSRSRFYVFIRTTILRHPGIESLRHTLLPTEDLDWPALEPRLIR